MRTATQKYPPRIEALTIADLRIGDLREGCIWSGNYEWQTELVGVDSSLLGVPFATTGTPDDGCVRKCAVVHESPYNPSDDFVQLASVDIGCIGNVGHVWFKDCPRFVVRRSCLGGLHVPYLDVGQVIWIGDRLGRDARFDQEPDRTRFCDCVQNDPAICVEDCVSGTIPLCGPVPDTGESCVPSDPRPLTRAVLSFGDHLGATDVASNSDHQAGADGIPDGDRVIRGQVIINGNNHPLVPSPLQDRWEGHVTTGPTIPRSPCQPGGSGDLTPLPQIALRPPSDPTNPAADQAAPYYNLTPRDLGNAGPSPVDGGSIGLAPFHLHETGCVPPHNRICQNDGIPEADFDYTASVPVIIQHYGPIQRSSPSIPWSSCVKIEAQPMRHCPTDTVLPGVAESCSWVDVSPMFQVRGPGDAGWTRPNAIGLSRAPGMVPKPGIYRVKLVLAAGTGLPRIRCADVSGNPPVVWPASCIDTDSNGDFVNPNTWGLAYVFKIATDCDHNHINDEVVPATDANCRQKTCRVDVNGTNGISVQDIFDFLEAWFSGCTSSSQSGCHGINADWNLDGSLAIADVFDYLAAWFASGPLGCQ